MSSQLLELVVDPAVGVPVLCVAGGVLGAGLWMKALVQLPVRVVVSFFSLSAIVCSWYCGCLLQHLKSQITQGDSLK